MIEDLNKAFDNRIRLGIMSILMVNDQIDFASLKELLQLTDGNLASHIKTLEKKNLIEIHKEFVNKKPKTTYKATKEGQLAFKKHLNALERILKQTKKD